MNYYDILVRHAFDNYLDLLLEVTFSPLMGAPHVVEVVLPSFLEARELNVRRVPLVHEELCLRPRPELS